MSFRELLTIGELVGPSGQTIFFNPANTAPSAQAAPSPFATRAFKKGDIALSTAPAASTAAVWFCVTAGVGSASAWKSLTLSA